MVATSELSAPSPGRPMSLRSTRSSRSLERIRPAARRPTTSKPQAAAARAQTTAPSATSGPATSSREAPANERAATWARSTAWARTSSAASTPRTASAASASRASRARCRRRRSNAAIRSGRGRVARDGLAPAHPRAEDVVRPALVEQDEGDEDRRNDAHHGERVVRRGGVLDREAVREVGARDHHARIERGEERRNEADRSGRSECERGAAPAEIDEDEREDERGDRDRRRQHGRVDALVVAVDRDDDRPDEVAATD